MTFQQWLTQAIVRLSQSESPRRDAEILLGHVTGRARTYILAFGETALTAAQAAELETLLSRRARGEPVAHLVGQREFWRGYPTSRAVFSISAPAPAPSLWRWPANAPIATSPPLT